MKIQVFESDCKCSNTYATIKEIFAECDCSCKNECQIEQITDFMEIAKNNIMSLPTIVINGKIVSSGKKLNKEQIKDLLMKNNPNA